jgi:hypothetical protein
LTRYKDITKGWIIKRDFYSQLIESLEKYSISVEIINCEDLIKNTLKRREKSNLKSIIAESNEPVSEFMDPTLDFIETKS